MSTQALLTIREVMARIKRSDEAVYRYIRSGNLRAVRVGGGWRVSEAALREFLARRE